MGLLKLNSSGIRKAAFQPTQIPAVTEMIQTVPGLERSSLVATAAMTSQATPELQRLGHYSGV